MSLIRKIQDHASRTHQFSSVFLQADRYISKPAKNKFRNKMCLTLRLHAVSRPKANQLPQNVVKILAKYHH